MRIELTRAGLLVYIANHYTIRGAQQYKVRINGKVEQSKERSSAPPTPWCSSYWKGSYPVALDYGRQLYFTYSSLIIRIYLRSYKESTISYLILIVCT